MKRFHIHVAVNDIEASVDFYSKLFGQAPSKQHPDYAKWMLEDPCVNFAISSRGHPVGVNHLGFQAESAAELDTLKQRANTASAGEILDEGETACCYSNSEKHWTLDPQGIAWEHFQTMSDAIEYGNDSANPGNGCCVPSRETDTSSRSPSDDTCCVPSE